MSLLERLKRWHNVGKLRRKARRSPSPAAYAEFAERLVALGDIDHGLRAAEEGLEVFPDSERLLYVRSFAKKRRMTGRIRKLHDELQRRPNPASYGQLAETYRDLGSDDEALETAAECAERFPLNEMPYMVQGEIRLARFTRDMIAKDATAALTALEKVARINHGNHRAHLLLAQLHWLVGDLDTAVKHLKDVLAATPNADDVRRFVGEIEGARTGTSRADTEKPFEDLAEKVEGDQAFANELHLFPGEKPRRAPVKRAPYDPVRIAADVERLGGEEGMSNAMVLDRQDRCVAEFTGNATLTSGQFVEMITAIRDTADQASRRMDTGALVRAEIEGPAGNLTVARACGFTVAVLYGDPLRPDRVWELLQDFVSKDLAGVREGAHA